MTSNLGHLEIKLFRFNHSMDYLPYYRTYKLEYTKDECIYDIGYQLVCPNCGKSYSRTNRTRHYMSCKCRVTMFIEL